MENINTAAENPSPSVGGKEGSLALPGVWALLKESVQIYKLRWKKLAAIGKPMLLLFAGYVVAIVLAKLVSGIFVIAGVLCLIAFYVFIINFILSLIVFLKNPEGAETPERIRTVGWSYFWPSILVHVLAGLVAIIGWMLLIIPGIIISIRLAFAQYVLVTENKRGLSALGRSWYLVFGNSWKVFGRQIALAVIFAIFAIIFGLVAGLILGKTLGGLISQAVSFLVLTPIGIFYSYRIYQIIASAKISNEEAEKKYAKKAKVLAWCSPIVFIILGVLSATMLVSLNGARLKYLQSHPGGTSTSTLNFGNGGTINIP